MAGGLFDSRGLGSRRSALSRDAALTIRKKLDTAFQVALSMLVRWRPLALWVKMPLFTALLHLSPHYTGRTSSVPSERLRASTCTCVWGSTSVLWHMASLGQPAHAFVSCPSGSRAPSTRLPVICAQVFLARRRPLQKRPKRMVLPTRSAVVQRPEKRTLRRRMPFNPSVSLEAPGTD